MRPIGKNASMLRLPCSLMFALVVMFAGCADGVAARRVDPTLAESTLAAVLESWQRGEDVEIWRKKNPEVVIQDIDWTSGLRLKSFEIVGDGKAVDANLYCVVKLTLEDGQKQELERTVTYVIGTSPVCTVFRSFG